jgi:hypothetical protein
MLSGCEYYISADDAGEYSCDCTRILISRRQGTLGRLGVRSSDLGDIGDEIRTEWFVSWIELIFTMSIYSKSDTPS